MPITTDFGNVMDVRVDGCSGRVCLTGDQGEIARQAFDASHFTPQPTSRATHLVDTPTKRHAAGAMVSTPHDVDRLIRAIVDGELISSDAHAEQLTWRDAAYRVDYWYGLGLIKYHGNIGHNGNLPGYQTTAMHHPDRDLTVVILTNMYRSPKYEEPADALLFVTVRHLTGQSDAPPGWSGR